MKRDESNEQLAASAQNGDDHAAAELVQRFYRPIYAFIRRQTFNDEDAADLTQKTFSDAWQSLPQFGARSQFSTWLHKIAHHTYVNWVRQHTRRHVRETRWWELNHETESSPFEDFEALELAHRVFQIVDEMEEDLRRPVHLHYYQHLTLKDTAEILEISPSTLKNRLRKAIGIIRDHHTLLQTPEKL